MSCQGRLARKKAQYLHRINPSFLSCQLISQQMSSLCVELQEKQSFSSFLQVVKEKEQKKSNKEKRREIDMKLKLRKSNLQRQQQELLDKSKELERLSSYCAHLRDEIAFEKMQQISVQKPMQKKSCKAENLLEDELELLQKKMKEERRVHEESEKFLQNTQKELQQVLQNWQQCTKQMLQEKEDQLNNTSCKRTLNFDRIMEMRRKLRVMEQVVMEDKEEQEQLRQQQAEATAAIKLQAWWRCCMVRRGLGPFKKVEEKKKGKKMKKKGKNKK
ncbi:dynein regulatory complex protein 9 isoform X2 [Melanotaenia boesemani]|uniref:dynein regulatory complex protein 9 isoform X2 n=1 Tax=Melanotaenia boesemani TaxID=1250792 RepID=UPI001C0567D6|nr:dynein regulatory complex protein 9 isoform X2 [Melanotaenia boesemani]